MTPTMTPTTIKAPEGMRLTQADPNIDDTSRVMATSVTGYGDLEALWRTATADEYAAWQAAQEAAATAAAINNAPEGD